jgi:DNA-binding transcriptional regulator YiaG
MSDMNEEELPGRAVQMLVAWRQRNGLSQRAAVEFMRTRGLPVTLTVLEKWEMGINRPVALSAVALIRFFEEHPTVSNE